jgi:hypothetical protein
MGKIWLRAAGIVLATFLFVHDKGMPWGLLWGVVVLLLFI